MWVLCGPILPSQMDTQTNRKLAGECCHNKSHKRSDSCHASVETKIGIFFLTRYMLVQSLLIYCWHAGLPAGRNSKQLFPCFGNFVVKTKQSSRMARLNFSKNNYSCSCTIESVMITPKMLACSWLG